MPHTSERRTAGRPWRALGAGVLAATVLAAGLQGGAGGAATTAGTPSSFYTYTGSKALSTYAPGAVLKTRTLTYHLLGIDLPLKVTQLVYRTTDQRGRAIAGVTSVIAPPLGSDSTKVLAYNSFYDSLNPEDGPSRSIAGGTAFGQAAGGVETALFVPFLLQGISVVVTDTEGPAADFAAGPVYGKVTLDGLRAASNSPATGISRSARIGMLGYSGGAIATNWAAALAPSYAPDINKRLIGAAEGGVLVSPGHNIHYVEGSSVWAGVIPMALIGVARAAGVDVTPYLSAYGRTVYAKLRTASIFEVLGTYPGLTWKQLAKPQYPTPESVPIYVTLANKLNLGAAPSPTVPMFIGQGSNGILEGTPGIGTGDGVMIAGDVRSLARKYCAAGTKVEYHEYSLTSHVTTVPFWTIEAVAWLVGRFANSPAPSSCGQIAPGNSLGPIKAAPTK